MSEEQHAGVVGGLLVEAGREGGPAWRGSKWRRGYREEEGEERDCQQGPHASVLNFFPLFSFSIKTRSPLGILLRPLGYFKNYENI